MSGKAPAFQLYPAELLSDGRVAAMSVEQVGCYVLLLCYAWRETGLPDDAKILARWLRLPQRKFNCLWAIVRECFVLRDGRWFNPRLEKERVKQAIWREKSSIGGQRSANRRKGGGKGGSDLVGTKGQPSASTLQSSSSSSNPPNPPRAGGGAEGGGEPDRIDKLLPDATDWRKLVQKPEHLS